ncbi:MAG TPA: nitroreductase family deazaflavin-dependent oxidoreductase [Amycolatopsis sp.]
MGLLTEKPPAWLHWIFRAPIVLYRVGLGRLLGHRLVYIVHIGRTTGRRRETVLETIRYDPATPEAIVVSGRGPASDWYRNLEATPAAEIRTGAQHWLRPAHRVLDVEETIRLLTGYRDAHPRLWARLSPLIGAPRELDEQTWHDLAGRLRAVAFTPPNPPA